MAVMRHRPFLLSAVAAAALAGCATPPPAPPTAPAGVTPGAIAAAAAAVSASATATGRPPTAVAVVPVPGQPQAFATVIKDARRIDGGLFTVWQKDEKFWFELAPEDFGRPFVFGPKIAQGIGESGLYGG